MNGVKAIDLVNRNVKARHAIEDSPLAEVDGSCARGAVGYCEDFDGEMLYVDFGRGAIMCDPSEVRIA